MGSAVLGTSKAEGMRLGTAPTDNRQHARHGVIHCLLTHFVVFPSRKSTETLGNRPGLVATTSDWMPSHSRLPGCPGRSPAM